jgi:hypothetical protein
LSIVEGATTRSFIYAANGLGVATTFDPSGNWESGAAGDRRKGDAHHVRALRYDARNEIL